MTIAFVNNDVSHLVPPASFITFREKLKNINNLFENEL
jgi:hypothetical protein